ncbi:Small subunit (SSU) processome component [Myotisia sp. PD_48]|nr:Small subunit (SSU) processome component [Myotisia sp. PD_48]
MVSKKSSRGPVSKISSAATPTASAATVSAKKSSIIRSSFSPSEYQLGLFASVIQGLDSHHLRVHNAVSGRLQCEHAVNPKEAITSLDWGYFGDSQQGGQHLKKKRKRSSAINGVSDVQSVVIAFGLSTSDIRMYNPMEDRIVGTLSGGHERGIRDFKFTIQKPSLEGWSIGGDGKLVQWDLTTGKSIRTVSLPSISMTALARPVPSNPPVLCASQTPYLIDMDTEDIDKKGIFSSMKNPIHSLVSSSADSSDLNGPFLASDSDRYINVFSSENRKLLGSLVADKEVDSVSYYSAIHEKCNTTSSGSSNVASEKQLLAVLTRDGAIELFSNPFHQFSDGSRNNAPPGLKSLRKHLTRRPDAIIKLVRPDKSRAALPVVSVSFDRTDLAVAWVEGGIDLVFDRIPWQDEAGLGLRYAGETELVRNKSSHAIRSTMMNGGKSIGKTHVDESHAVVGEGGLAEGNPDQDQEQAAASDASGDEDEEMDDVEPTADDSPQKSSGVGQRKDDGDVEMADMDDTADETGGEPSFGELLRANASQHIDVVAELKDTENALVPSQNTTSIQLTSSLSLATVLSQSLKTNDNSLLESCFHTADLDIVKTTVQRLDSSLATTLLQRLAERLSTRPGRYGNLLYWIQWTCIAHGGFIAGNPGVLKQMTALFKVIDQRSSTLPSLLLLKGKLDMLDAQLLLRQSLQVREGRADGDEERVIYVEGQDELDSADEADLTKTIAERDGDEDMPLLANGLDDTSDEEEENLMDDEAEVSNDGGSSDDQEEDDEEEDDEEEDEGSLVDFIADSDAESEISYDEYSSKAVAKGKLKRGQDNV